jgi:hypothetical protein
MAPLKIGVLGAARIADDGIVDPSRVLGHRLVAVAARDRARAEAFAAQRGVEKVHQTHAEVIDDPEVEVVYNALVNSLHAKWNLYPHPASRTTRLPSQDGWRGIPARSEHSLFVSRWLTCQGSHALHGISRRWDCLIGGCPAQGTRSLPSTSASRCAKTAIVVV